MKTPKEPHGSNTTKAGMKVRGSILKINSLLNTYHAPAARAEKRRKPEVKECDLFNAAVLLFDYNMRRPYGQPATTQESEEVLRGELSRAVAEADPSVFQTLARAAEHVRNAANNLTTHAMHVIAAQRVAGELFQRGETPTKQAVIEGARADIKAQGRAAYPDSPSSIWTPILRDAGLKGLPKSNPGGSVKKHGSEKRRK